MPWAMRVRLDQNATVPVRVSCEKPRSVPMQSQLGSVVVPDQHSVVGFKVLLNFYATGGLKGAKPLQSVNLS